MTDEHAPTPSAPSTTTTTMTTAEPAPVTTQDASVAVKPSTESSPSPSAAPAMMTPAATPSPAASTATVDAAVPVTASTPSAGTSVSVWATPNVTPSNAAGSSAALAPTEATPVPAATAGLVFKSQEEHDAELTRRVEAYGKRMSDLCPGFVGSDIASICNEAAILAAREHAPFVELSHLERSIDRVLAGIEHRARIMNPFERNIVAHHEAGHAVAGWFLNRADPLMKVSIVPRAGKALGYAQYLPNETSSLKTAEDLIEQMCVTLGGRVAEVIFFNHLSTGASDDLQKVTRLAYAHATSFGQDAAYTPASASSMSPYSEITAQKVDAAVKSLIDQAYQRTYDLLLAHKADMEALAKHLLEKEILTHADVVAYLGNRGDRPKQRRFA